MLVRVNGRRFRVNIMPATTSRSALWLTVFTATFDTEVFIRFPDRLTYQATRKIHVITDRHPVHRAKNVTAWLADNSDASNSTRCPATAPNSTPTRP